MEKRERKGQRKGRGRKGEQEVVRGTGRDSINTCGMCVTMNDTKAVCSQASVSGGVVSVKLNSPGITGHNFYKQDGGKRVNFVLFESSILENWPGFGVRHGYKPQAGTCQLYDYNLTITLLKLTFHIYEMRY